MTTLIDESTYLRAAKKFVDSLKKIHQERKFDTIVAPKRSGLFLGVWASHLLGLPMFVPSELRSMPNRFGNVLIVDAAVCTGKTLKKIQNQLKPRQTFTAVIWREGEGTCDFVLKAEDVGIIKFFYEGR